MSSKTGGKTKKSDNFSQVLQADLRIAYAVRIKSMEYMVEIDLSNWGFGRRNEEEIGFYSLRLGPVRVAYMNRDTYDEFLAVKIEDVLAPLGQVLNDRKSRADRVAPQDVPPKDALN